AQGEGRAAAFAWCGAAASQHWSAPDRVVDFFDIKGVVDALAAALGLAVEYAPVERGFLAAGRAAEVRANGRLLGLLGQLSPSLAETRGFPASEPIYVAEIDLGSAAAAVRDE